MLAEEPSADLTVRLRSEWRGSLVDRIFDTSLIHGPKLLWDCFRLLCAFVLQIIALPGVSLCLDH